MGENREVKTQREADVRAAFVLSRKAVTVRNR